MTFPKIRSIKTWLPFWKITDHLAISSCVLIYFHQVYLYKWRAPPKWMRLDSTPCFVSRSAMPVYLPVNVGRSPPHSSSTSTQRAGVPSAHRSWVNAAGNALPAGFMWHLFTRSLLLCGAGGTSGIIFLPLSGVTESSFVWGNVLVDTNIWLATIKRHIHQVPADLLQGSFKRKPDIAEKPKE